MTYTGRLRIRRVDWMAVQIARWMVSEKRTLKQEKQACAIRQPRKMESSNAAIVLARGDSVL